MEAPRLATDHITVDGHRVGYMYREQGDFEVDSGWRFFSGLESDEYANDPENLTFYDVNTIPCLGSYRSRDVSPCFRSSTVSGPKA